MMAGVEVYCDFDGTVTQGDTIDLLLEELGDPQWREIEARWERGEIGSRQCMALQVPLLRGGWKAIEQVLSTVKIDPTFAEFAFWCRQSGIPVRVVSDGIDRVIHHLLQREGVRVDYVWANHLVESAGGELSLTFPYASNIEGCGSGLCKCKILDAGVRTIKVVIGDGRSDFCWSTEADILFAKSKLLQYCKIGNIPCVPFDNFRAVRVALEKELSVLVHPLQPAYPAAAAIVPA